MPTSRFCIQEISQPLESAQIIALNSVIMTNFWSQGSEVYRETRTKIQLSSSMGKFSPILHITERIVISILKIFSIFIKTPITDVHVRIF